MAQLIYETRYNNNVPGSSDQGLDCRIVILLAIYLERGPIFFVISQLPSTSKNEIARNFIIQP
jgi:hypothetical protein